MSQTVLKIPELSGLEVGCDAVSFAILARRDSQLTKHNSPYWRCVFQDRFGSKEFMVWSNNPLFDQVSQWSDGQPHRLRVRAKSSTRGVELSLVEVRHVQPEDAQEGFNESDLYETSRFDAEESFQAVRKLALDEIKEEPLRELVVRILDSQQERLKRMPAAMFMHHAFTGGLMEHIRSLARISLVISRHYERYYSDLDPCLDVGLIVAAAILHDIGKLFELEYHPAGARYTIPGKLIGHIVLGRDLIRQTAAEIPGFSGETLLQLEHAILAHHGQMSYGSPIEPQTMEALIVSLADDLDAKVNQVARARLQSRSPDPFTDEVRLWETRRRIYKGIPRPSSRGGPNGQAESS